MIDYTLQDQNIKNILMECSVIENREMRKEFRVKRADEKKLELARKNYYDSKKQA